MTQTLRLLLLATITSAAATAYSQQISGPAEWLTTPDRVSLLKLQPEQSKIEREAPGEQPTITIDDKQAFQTLDGFGFALTGGSAQLMMKMSKTARARLLRELFSLDDAGIGVSYLRVSIGSSDMNDRVFTYDDLPPGQTDPRLKHFNLGPDLQDVIPVLREILAISPNIKILATPWSAPSWMKTNHLPKAGSLEPDYYQAYALYLATYIKAMEKHHIRIDAMTPQNEPLNPNNTPSMVMTADEEAAFISQALGPTFQKEGLRTKIIVYDHNCDRPDYPLAIYADSSAARYVDGSGFHLYGGTIDALTKVHEAYPDKHVYFTEQMVIDNPKHGSELRIARPVEQIVIGSVTNWSRNVLLWNLAADPNFGPHTPDGGCPICEGAITLNGDSVTRNLAYYTIAHVSRFVRPGATRIASTATGNVPAHVAFRNLDGTVILLVANSSDAPRDFAVRYQGHLVNSSIPAGSAATYTWGMH